MSAQKRIKPRHSPKRTRTKTGTTQILHSSPQDTQYWQDQVNLFLSMLRGIEERFCVAKFENSYLYLLREYGPPEKSVKWDEIAITFREWKVVLTKLRRLAKIAERFCKRPSFVIQTTRVQEGAPLLSRLIKILDRKDPRPYFKPGPRKSHKTLERERSALQALQITNKTKDAAVIALRDTPGWKDRDLKQMMSTISKEKKRLAKK